METKTKLLDLYSDSMHGGVKVELSEIYELNIQDKISSYSYMNDRHAFLEEDSDLTTYINALKTKGYKVKLITKSTVNKSSIRDLKPFDTKNIVILYRAR